jgi:signal peptidase I
MIGLPNESLRIYHGDIYAKGAQDADYVLARKPPDKVRAMAQVVHDSESVSPRLLEAGWPARWQPQGGKDALGAWQVSADTRQYAVDGSASGEAWLRYEHRVPSEEFWRAYEEGRSQPGGVPRPQLITDFYAFNTRVLRDGAAYGVPPSALGLHWVGDLVIECEADVRSSGGTVLLDLVKGGRHFRAAIDIAGGRAELSIDGLPLWRRGGETQLRGPGRPTSTGSWCCGWTAN